MIMLFKKYIYLVGSINDTLGDIQMFLSMEYYQSQKRYAAHVPGQIYLPSWNHL